MKKRFFGGILACLMAVTVTAQVSNTLSPYSQFGLGVLADQSQSMGRGMGGLGVGLRDGRHANALNPASYSAVDSLTMVIDLGVSGQLTNFKEGGVKLNRKTADFDYAVALFRVLPKLGASMGVIPYSNIGYNYYSEHVIGSVNGKMSESKYRNEYVGSGGFSQAFVGLGWEFAKGFSVGANFSYFWGKYSRAIASIFADSYSNDLTKTYSYETSSWKLDLGAQWTGKLGSDDRLTIGAVASIGHKLPGDAYMSTVNTSAATSVSTTTRDSVPDAFSLPYTFGGGVSLVHKNSLTVGVDYTFQRWGELKYPYVNEATNRYEALGGILKDRHKVVAGIDWIPNRVSPKFLNHIHYRLGASYATPYYNIGSIEGPKEMSVSAGFGIPVVNVWNNRTSVNITGQWVRSSANGFITENTFRINIGLTFTERWFAKWKVD